MCLPDPDSSVVLLHHNSSISQSEEVSLHSDHPVPGLNKEGTGLDSNNALSNVVLEGKLDGLAEGIAGINEETV